MKKSTKLNQGEKFSNKFLWVLLAKKVMYSLTLRSNQIVDTLEETRLQGFPFFNQVKDISG